MNEQLTLIAFGAFIGLITGVLGRVIHDSILIGQKKRRILDGFISELKELKYQYLMNIYLIYGRYALLNRESIDWLLENLEEYQNSEELDKTLESLRRLSKLNDPEFSELLERRKSESQGKSLIPKKSRIMFIEQNLDYLDIFDEDFQYKILKIMKGIDRLNQQIDIARTYDMKTFEVDDEDNHRKICANLDLSIQNLGRWQELSANDVSDFIKNYEKMSNEFRFTSS